MEIETNEFENTNATDRSDNLGVKFSPNWASDAPLAGRAVLTRILK